MKKSMTALAALGLFAGAAGAQSSVTVYGIVDMVGSKMNSGQSNLTFMNDWQVGNRDQWTLRSSASSRIGVRGTEDLGGGYKAFFQMEHRFAPDTGAVEPRDGVSGTFSNRTAAPGFWNSQTFVGVSGAFGEIKAGRLFTPVFWIALPTDPFGYEFNLAGAASFTRGGNGVSTANNSVAYTTPTLSGLSAMAMVSAGEGGNAAVATPGTGRNVGFNVQYTSGPFWVGLGYNDAKRFDALDNRATVLGTSYDFRVVKVSLGLSTAKNAVAGNPSTKTMALGATVPAGPGFVRAVAARYDAAVGQNPNASVFSPYNAFGFTNGANTDKFGVGYVYFLSKRTSLSADVGMAKTDGFSRSLGYQAGIKHTF